MALLPLIRRCCRFVTGLSGNAFFAGAVGLFAIVILALICVSSLFMHYESAIYDTGRFFEMAKVIVDGATPYQDYQDPKPPLIFFTLALPVLLGQQFLGGLLLVGLCNLISAVVVLKIGEGLYGRIAGLAAGLLFLVNLGWAQGYFVMTEPFAVLFVLLATYLALFGEPRRYLAAGLCAGAAVGYKQYALIALPLLLLAMGREGQLKRAPAFLSGIALPLLAMFGLIFFAYSAQAMDAALYWSFGVAAPYVARDDVSPVISTGTDALELAFNVVIALVVAGSLAAGLRGPWKRRKRSTGEAYILFAAIGFSLTLLIREYLHYWALALPFLAILWAGWLFDRGGPTSQE